MASAGSATQEYTNTPSKPTQDTQVKTTTNDSFFTALEESITINWSDEKEKSSSDDSKEHEKEKSSSEESKEREKEETRSDDSEDRKEEHRSAAPEEISVEIPSAALMEQIARNLTEQKARDNTLLSALAVQAGLFSTFQLRAILYDSISGPLSKPMHIIAKQSQPFLLAPAVVTVGIEIGCRVKNLIHAPADHVQMAREGLATALIKAVTVGTFCLNALYEQIGKPDPRVAYAAGLFFSALIFIEMLISAKTSAALPSTYYMCIAFFVDFFVKSFIFPSTIMQLSSKEEIVLIGNIMAMVGFLAVMSNVLTIKRHLNSENANIVSDHDALQHLHSDEERGGIPSPAHSINSGATESTALLPAVEDRAASLPTSTPPLSTNPQTFWKGFYSRARNLGNYFGVNNLSTAPRPGE